MKKQNFNSSKANFNRIIYTIVFLSLIIFAFVFYLFKVTITKFEKYSLEQRKSSLKEKVLMARNSISPIIDDYNNNIISKDSAIEKTRLTIKKMIYADEYGMNYIFMNTMDGVVLARPFRPQDELKNQLNYNDFLGIGMRSVIDAVKNNPDGAFATYIFSNPANNIEEEKLSFALLIPEFNAHIGTGAYVSSAVKSQLKLLRETFILAIISAVLIAFPIIITLFILKKKNYTLIEQVRENQIITDELKKKEEDLRITLSSIGDAVITTDANGFITLMNKQAQKLTGWNIEKALNQPFEDVFNIINSKTLEKCENPIKKVLNSGRIIYLSNETQLISKDGTARQIADSAAPIRNDDGEIVGVVLVFRDISEEYKLKNEALEKENAFKTIFETSPFVITIVKVKDLTLQLVNKAFEKITHVNRQNAFGKTLEELNLVYDVEVYKKNIAEAIEKKSIENIFGKERLSDGKEIFTLFSSRVFIYNGEESILTISNDISEFRKMQEHLSHSQKMDAIGQLAGGIAHDFNNMLSGILGAAELLKLENLSIEKKSRYMNLLLDSTKKASELTGKLLSFARKEKLDSNPVDINEVISNSVELLTRTIDKKNKIETFLNAKLTTILGDTSQLMNVFINLGINSSHAMPNGGEIKISTRNVILENSFCKNSSFDIHPGEYILVEVQDNGIGIEPELLPKIFDPFFTTKEQGKGTGLGLSMVYGSIVQHRGAINVYSELGKGVVFHIYLPVLEANKAYESIESNEKIFGSGRILIVDDEEIIRLTMNDILESLGYKTILANNGKEAVDIFANNFEHIDLVLMDMIMPIMNGKECFYELKKIKNNVKIILSSGFTRENDINDLLDNGLIAFIRKPIHTTELSQIIYNALNKK